MLDLYLVRGMKRIHTGAIRLALFSLEGEERRIENKITKILKRPVGHRNSPGIMKLSLRLRKVTAALNGLENALDDINEIQV